MFDQKHTSKHLSKISERGSILGPVLVIVAVIGLFALASFAPPDFFSENYASVASSSNVASASASKAAAILTPPVVATSSVTHIKPPENIKALYMTSWVAGTHTIESHVENLLKTTEANAVVIDIKDYTGDISFETGDASLDNSGCIDKRIPDIKSLIQRLHSENIYVIGRVAVFQDPCFGKLHPEFALKRVDNGEIWKDDKGISWLDPSKSGVVDHVVEIANASYADGFDEINLDYVRFPSDGNTKNIVYPTSTTSKPAIMLGFFQAINKALRPAVSDASNPDQAFTTLLKTIADPSKTEAGRMVVSADLFGLTTMVTDGLGIGQVMENVLPNVDYVDPMVYPSHFANGWEGYKNPAEHPYDVIKISMGKAASTTAALGLSTDKLRPWLQYFNLGAVYTTDMIRTQMQATYDVGLKSWLLWDPNNKYAVGGLLSK